MARWDYLKGMDKRHEVLSLSVTKAEKEYIRKYAEKLGVPTSVFVRTLVLNHIIDTETDSNLLDTSQWEKGRITQEGVIAS